MLGFAGTRNWVYTQSQGGFFQRLRWKTFFVLHLVLFVTPWLTWRDNPLLRLDLPGRRVYAFGAMFTAADTVLLLLLLLFAAFSLFFFTSLFGRVWCGYACPQTVLLDTWIRPVEAWIEGDRNARMKRDRGPVTFDLAWRKVLKWTVFAAAAVAVAGSFMSFFVPASRLWTFQLGAGTYALVGLFALFWFLNFVWFREQACNYLCPYARFQSALSDDESLAVTYDVARGEPRGGATAKAEGRCIDCRKCVVVCPQGIDIRNGFQLECIACARCVDACTSVMDKLGHETLIAYGSIAESQGRTVRRLRPRTVVYGSLLTGIAAAAVVLLVKRVPIEAQVGRLPGSLFTLDADGFVRNTFMLHITNNRAGRSPVPYTVEVEGLTGAQVIAQPVSLGAAQSSTMPLVVRVPEDKHLPRTMPIRVVVRSPTDAVRLDATFKTDGHIDDDATD